MTLPISSPAAEPVRLTDDGSLKRDPRFVKDGKELVYCYDEAPDLIGTQDGEVPTGDAFGRDVPVDRRDLIGRIGQPVPIGIGEPNPIGAAGALIDGVALPGCTEGRIGSEKEKSDWD